MPAQKVVVIGAGVIGASVARALALTGYGVTVVDRLPAAGYGSTSYSSAIVRPFYSHVEACAIAHEARYRWLDWPGFLGTGVEDGFAQYTESGGLILFAAGQEDDFAGNMRALEEIGVAYSVLDAAGVEALYPGISRDRFGPAVSDNDEMFGQPTDGALGGGIHIPAAGYVSDPQLAARNLANAAQAAGAVFRFNTAVTAISRTAGRVTGVTLSDGELEADIVINVGGPNSSLVNDLAGVTLPISTRASRHEVAYVPAPPGYIEGGNGFLADVDSGFYMRPDQADVIVGTTDPACDDADIVDPDDYNRSLTDHWTRQVFRAAQRFPALAITGQARGTVGLYDVSDDWIPIYDKTDLAGYFVAIGTSGNQFKNGPIAGDIMRTIIDVEMGGGDHDRTPASIHLPNVDREIDLSFYSRLRTVQATASVLA